MRRITAWIAIVVLSIGVLAAVVAAGSAAWQWLGGGEATPPALVAEGVVTTGQVIAVEVSAGTVTRLGQPTSARYFVTYRFSDSAGVAHEVITSGSGEGFAFTIGETIPIRYLPDNPEVSAFTGAGNATGKTPLPLIAVWAIGGFACAYGARKMLATALA